MTDEATASEAEEQPTLYRGIKRTIRSRNPAARASSAVPEGAASTTEGADPEAKAGSQDTLQEAAVNKQEEAEPDAEEALRRADDKRRALQKQLAKNSVPKAKKRKF